MIQIETNAILKYLCSAKIVIVFMAILFLLGEQWLGFLMLLFVGLGVVIMDDKRAFEVNDNELIIYRIGKVLEGKKVSRRITFSEISRIILRSRPVFCLSQIVIECNHIRCYTIDGNELSKNDFYQLLDQLKQNNIFEVQVV